MIHLDTNFLVNATVAGSPADANFRTWSVQNEEFAISTVAWAEFLCGPVDAIAEKLARQICSIREPLLQSDSELAAELFNKTGRSHAPWLIV